MKAFLLAVFMVVGLYGHSAVLTVTVVTGNASCGMANGSITSMPVGGTTPYTYLWSTGDITGSLAGLVPGTYTVTVTDAMGATATASGTVTASTFLQNVSFTYTVPGQPPWGPMVTLPCHSQCNGIAYLDESAIVGTPPYAISVINSNNPFPATGIVNGVNAVYNICSGDYYNLLVTDANGCSNTASPFTWPSKSFAHQQQIKAACFGQNNGSVTLNFTNLYSQDLDITYSGPVSNSVSLFNPVTISNLLPGSYTFNIAYPQIVSCDTSITIVIPDLGTNCGVISGSVFLDTLSNCNLDTGEPLIPNQMIRFDPGPFFTFSDSAGNFNAALPYANYTATLLSNAPLFPVCTQSNLNLTALNDTISNVLFADSVNTDLNLETNITAGFFRPGFIGGLYVNVKNTSYALVPYPQLDVYFDSTLTYSSSALPPVLNAPGHLRFMLNLLNGFQGSTLPIYFQVPPDPNLIGSTLSFVATATANLPENDLTDNTDSVQVTVTGSFDPNDKAVEQARDSLNSFYTNLDTEIRYRIRFQNTGTDTAFKVVVIDTLSLALNPSTFRLLASSHTVQTEIIDSHVLKFTFNNILLPDSNTNEPESHGVISFSIEPYTPVTVANIENKAEIYFDFNPPIVTNTVVCTIGSTVGIESPSAKNTLTLIPNPASTIVIVDLQQQMDAVEVTLYDLLGKNIQSVRVPSGSTQLQLDVSGTSNGFYFVKVKSASGTISSAGLIINH